jgi:hypothetical protein
VDDLDAADFDDDGSPILHAGDVDGVDIDVLDDDTRTTTPTTTTRTSGVSTARRRALNDRVSTRR